MDIVQKYGEILKKRNAILALLPLFAMLFVACDDEKTYSDMKEDERKVVKNFIREQGINIFNLVFCFPYQLLWKLC